MSTPTRPPPADARGRQRGARHLFGDEAVGRIVKGELTPGWALRAIVIVVTAVTVASGLLMTVFDRHQFPDAWAGMWWAVQTVTTVGYGDEIPTSVPGRFLAAAVMLIGIGFVSIVTAAVTAALNASALEKRGLSTKRDQQDQARQLDEIAARLTAIEQALAEPAPQDRRRISSPGG